ncbi:hypothetical protein Cni_G09060 [Canna indica]|uniref:Uncharacterized protein n=1 Tax=Canna indica TaxID=4628 RepID=A0AAQ3K509_9LILI|nr:hypothetical protein Cni_G09060 [Canna indica]
MLLAVEGGGFFSSSASGYSNGLAVLLLGRRNEEKPIKVSSRNQYRLVGQEVEPGSQLTSRSDHASCRCASFSCFGCAPGRLDGPSIRKVDHMSKTSSDSSSCSDRGKITVSLKSNMKKPSKDLSLELKDDDARELLEDAQNKTSCCTVGRKVQWTDKCGKDLAEIREFEVSDDDLSDEEYEGGSFRRCECVIQ